MGDTWALLLPLHTRASAVVVACEVFSSCSSFVLSRSVTVACCVPVYLRLSLPKHSESPNALTDSVLPRATVGRLCDTWTPDSDPNDTSVNSLKGPGPHPAAVGAARRTRSSGSIQYPTWPGGPGPVSGPPGPGRAGGTSYRPFPARGGRSSDIRIECSGDACLCGLFRGRRVAW